MCPICKGYDCQCPPAPWLTQAPMPNIGAVEHEPRYTLGPDMVTTVDRLRYPVQA